MILGLFSREANECNFRGRTQTNRKAVPQPRAGMHIHQRTAAAVKAPHEAAVDNRHSLIHSPNLPAVSVSRELERKRGLGAVLVEIYRSPHPSYLQCSYK